LDFVADDDAPFETVATALGHEFAHPDLLRDALTHRSYANERPKDARTDNERLEFLGDSVVGLVVSTMLWERFPDAPEGELTRRRADLVCEPSLAEIARAVGLGDALRLGRGEERSGGRDKPRLLASALEACFAAVYLDGSEAAAMRVGRQLFGSRIDRTTPGASDFKSRVQELVQSQRGITPRYEVLSAAGPDHERLFHVAVRIGEDTLGEGTGRSKGEAEQAAAEVAWTRLSAGWSDAGETLDEG
jgi:ribonuclease-3